MSASPSPNANSPAVNTADALPKIDALFPRVDQKLGQQQWEAATSMLEEMKAHFGDHPEIYKRFGLIHGLNGQLENCLSAFEQASRLGGDRDELGRLAFISLGRTGDWKVLENHFPRLRRIFSKQGFLASLSAIIEQAFNQEQWDQIEEWCRKGIEWLPDEPHLLHLAIELMLQTHRPEAAASLFDRLREVSPESQELTIPLKQLHTQLEKKKESRADRSESPTAPQTSMQTRRPIERTMSFDDDRLYFSMPGGMQELFYALPVIRQLIRSQGQEQGVFITSGECGPLRELLEAQPYLSEFLIDTETLYLNHLGVQPYIVLPNRPNCFNLGFRPFLMHSQTIGYSETLAVIFNIPYIDRDEQHLLVTPQPEHRFTGERYAVFCPETLLAGLFPIEFWQKAIQDVKQRFPVVLIGWKPSLPAADWVSENIENLIGRLSLAEAAGVLKGSACFFGLPSVPYHIARNVGTRPFVFSDRPIPPQSILAPDEIFSSQQLPEVLVHVNQMP